MSEKLTWKDAYVIGESEIDAQHRMLIELANQILSILPEADEEELQAGLLSLSEYMEAHFCAEEALMKRIGFPEREAHGDAHARILSEMQALMKRPISLEEIREAVSFLLVKWVEEHMHIMDAKIGAFLSTNV